MIVAKSRCNEENVLKNNVNECPATDICITCSECPYECKLRMETTINIEKVYAQPEPVLSDIYY